MIDTQQLNKDMEIAIQYHQAGQLQQAEALYNQILQEDPDHADALHLLGVIARQRRKYELAVELITKAIAENSSVSIFHNNLGNALKDLGRLDAAIECYEEALRLRPDYVEPQYNLALILQARGKLDAAIDRYREALRLRPGFPEAYNNLGNALKDQGRLDAAIECYEEALHLRPDYAEPHYNLALILQARGKLDAAIDWYREALRLRPGFPEAYNNLGNALKDQGRLDAAIECYEEALRLRPDYVAAHLNLGLVLRACGKLGAAIDRYREALRLRPGFPEAYNNLGNAFKDQGRLDEAMECFQKALQLKPDFARVHSNLLLSLNYCHFVNPAQLFSHHQQWAAQHASPLATTIQPHLNDRSPDRRLRVGYVSPDFRMHSVAYFIEPILASHERTAFEVFCYSDVVRPDSTTDHLKALDAYWRDILGMSDEQVADLIRNDQIDILVDLAGHTSCNRMLLFARKPAPVQATYLGYPNSTGLATMDYRLTDSWADAPGQTEQFYTEELVRLPHGFLCYKPPEHAPEVTKPPALKTEHITFGSFNHRAKITPEIVRLWSKILTSLANAKLLLKSRSLSDTGTQNFLREMFVKNGISPERIEFVGYIGSSFKHLELYNSIDIGLDTFPYNGTTTTCEAMWMGIPVIVLAGQRHISRVGVSLLSNIGLTELIAESTDAYLEKAVKLASDLRHLQTLRAGLRDMMSHSPLTDAHQFTRALENAYRKMWRRWLDQSHKYNASRGNSWSAKQMTETDPQLSIEQKECNKRSPSIFMKTEHVKSKTALLIAQVEPPQKGDGGDYFYRTHAPGIAVAQEKDVFVVNATNIHRRKEHIMREADVLVLKNICDPDILPLIRERKASGKLTVYEIADDLSALQPWNPVYSFYKNKENLALVYRLASCCDALQVTVPALKRLYGHLNKHCEVFLNQILHVPPERVFKESNEVVIGWGGSHGHLEDLAEIAEPLSNWIMTQPNVVLHLMCSDPIWDLFDPLPSHKKKRTLPGSIDEYYNFLAKIHIGIAPLKHTAFNRSRSDVKFLEYAVSGAVPVVAHLEPYLHSVKHEETGFLYQDALELIDILNRLVKDASLSRGIAKAARQYVMTERLQLKHGRDRIDFYIDWLKSVSMGKHQDGRAVQHFKEWSRLEGAVENGRHLRLMSTRFENLLHDGLVAMQFTSNKEQARAFFQEAVNLEPKNYLPFLFGASLLAEPVDSLRKAIELQPDSLKAWILLGEEWTRRGKIIKALQSFESALNVYPDYEIPYLRAADLLRKLGKKAEARSLFEKARELEIHHQI